MVSTEPVLIDGQGPTQKQLCLVEARVESEFADEETGVAFAQAAHLVDGGVGARHVAGQMDDDIAERGFVIEGLQEIAEALSQVFRHDDYDAGSAK